MLLNSSLKVSYLQVKTNEGLKSYKLILQDSLKVKNKSTHHCMELNVSGKAQASILAKLKATRNILGHKRHSVPKILWAPRYIMKHR